MYNQNTKLSKNTNEEYIYDNSRYYVQEKHKFSLKYHKSNPIALIQHVDSSFV